MQNTLTKYLASDLFFSNDFTKAFLELVDEIIFGCQLEARDILSMLSFEEMDDDYFVEFMSFFIPDLQTLDYTKLNRTVLSEWFSLLHARGELSNLEKLIKLGGAVSNFYENNEITLYYKPNVPETITRYPENGIIYAFTTKNVNLSEDNFIVQQIPAGYRIGYYRQPPETIIRGRSYIAYKKELRRFVTINSKSRVSINKNKQKQILFYRRRQFDQTYSFKQLYLSNYTIKDLSQFRASGNYFFGFDMDVIPLGASFTGTISNYTGMHFDYMQFFIDEGEII